MTMKVNAPLDIRQKISDKMMDTGQKPTTRNMASALGISTRTLNKILKGQEVEFLTADKVAKFVGLRASDIASEVSS